MTDRYKVFPGRIMKCHNDDTYEVHFKRGSYSQLEKFRVEDIADCSENQTTKIKKRNISKYQNFY